MGAAAASSDTGKRLRSNAALRQQVALAARLGVAPKRLWGWEPRTFYEYDEDGRMVSSWVESEWDDEQLDMIRAEAEIARLTGDLGEWLPDATDPKADPMEYSGFRFVPDGPHTNWAKKAQLDAMDELKKKLGENGNVNGVYFGATRTDY